MHRFPPLLSLASAACLTLLPLQAAQPPDAFTQASVERRKQIPLGGNFTPNPEIPLFVAVGHGGRILASADDGSTWHQVFFGHPGSDHGDWATNSVAYTNGVFAVSLGWPFYTAIIASEDGIHWRHLTDGSQVIKTADDPSDLHSVMAVAGGNGTFVATGFQQFMATPDFGKSWRLVNQGNLINPQPDRPRLNTHHIIPLYCGDTSGRVLAIGNDRRQETPGFGNLFATDDHGETWQWLPGTGLENANGYKYYSLRSNDQIVVFLDRAGENSFRSLDFGNTWEGPFPTGASPRSSLSVVDGTFWLTGSPGKQSVDGSTWNDLPYDLPDGYIQESEAGTLININPSRFTILRSTDRGRSWTEVHSFEPSTEYVHGAQGLRSIAYGRVNRTPVEVEAAPTETDLPSASQ